MKQYKEVRSCDFTKGVQIEHGRIKEWHEQILNELSKTLEHGYNTISSGNTIVIGLKRRDGEIKIIEATGGFHEYDYEPLKPPKP